MQDDSFLAEAAIQEHDKGVLKNMAELGEKLKQLKMEMLEAAEIADQKKKAYEHYANVVIPQEMYSLNLDSITLASGGTIRVKRNFYCQPNKNVEDKKIITDWLRKNGGEYLIKAKASVDTKDIDKLKSQGIAYIETADVNTTSLKSFIRDKLGVTTGVQQIKIEDIPACIHFQEVTTVELEM